MKDAVDLLMEVMDNAFDPHWREAWTRRQVTDSLMTPSTYAILMDPDGGTLKHGKIAAGFVLARRAPGEEELLLIAVHPDFRGIGIGRRLIEQFHRTAKTNGAERTFLEMRIGNPAENLYLSVGYEKIGFRRAYYTTSSGERIDAITFGKIL